MKGTAGAPGRWGARWREGHGRRARQVGSARQAGARRSGRVRSGRWACGLASGCALGALGLFSIRFDSVLFLSRFLDIVREPGS